MKTYIKYWHCFNVLLCSILITSFYRCFTSYAFPVYQLQVSTPPDPSITWNSDALRHEFFKSQYNHFHSSLSSTSPSPPLPSPTPIILKRKSDKSSSNRRDAHHENPQQLQQPQHQQQQPEQQYKPAVTSLRKFNDLLDFNELHNPCSPGQARRYQAIFREAPRVTSVKRVILGFLQEFVLKVKFLRGLTENIVKMNIVSECSLLKLPHISEVPSTAELIELTTGEGLIKLYKSLVNQTTHSYYIWQKQAEDINSSSCVYSTSTSNTNSHHPNHPHNPKENDVAHIQHHHNHYNQQSALQLSEDYKTLAVNFKDLMCLFSQSLYSLDVKVDQEAILNSALSHRIVDITLCSRRALRDCQIVRTSIKLLEEMNNYFLHKLENLD